MLKTLQSYQKLNRDKLKVPKSAQDTIPIDTIYADGIFKMGNKFSKTYRFSDINFSIASDEDKETMLKKYSAILNSVDSSVMAKITINNRKVDISNLERDVLFPLKDDELDIFRTEYNNLVLSKVKDADDIRQEKYITITIFKNNILEARNYFKRITLELNQRFGALGSKLTELDCTERLKLLHDFYRNGKEEEFTFDLRDETRKGHSFKDKIVPRKPTYKNDFFTLDEKYGRVLYLKDFSSFLDVRFVEKLCALNKNLMYSIDIISIPTDEAVKEVENKLLGVTTNITKWQQSQNRNYNFSATVPHDMETQRYECGDFLDELISNDQRMKICTFTLVHLADSKEELDYDTDSLKAIARENNCELETLYFSYRQLLGISQVLPIGLNHLNIYRTFSTKSLSSFVPFRAQEILEKGGIWHGQNAITNNPILINRENLQNANTWILGVPGSGKSFLAKEIMEFISVSTDDDIIIVDPEGEYDEIVKALQGQIVEIGANSKHFINAMDMTEGYGESGNSIADKSQFIMSLFEQLDTRNKQNSISSLDRSIIDRCVSTVYREKENPTLKDLYTTLLAQPETEAKTLAIKLELFTNGSLNIFSHHTNVDIQSRILSFNIFNLGKQLKAMGLLVITDAIINRVNYNWKNGKRTHVFIDEVHVVFENEESATFFASAWRQFRKRDAYPTGITQNIAYLLDSPQGTSMLSNSQFIIMLNQSANDRDKLTTLLNIPTEQMQYITDVPSGQGLIKYGSAIVPFINDMPKGWLQQLNSTKPSERKERIVRNE